MVRFYYEGDRATGSTSKTINCSGFISLRYIVETSRNTYTPNLWGIRGLSAGKTSERRVGMMVCQRVTAELVQ